MAGDFRGLGLLAKNLRDMAGIGKAAAPNAADAINVLLIKQRKAGTDPYGKAHAPLKRPRRSGRTGPPLVDSGQSYSKTVFYPRGDGIVGVLGGKLPYHMLKTRYRVDRAAFPRYAMPKAWSDAIAKAVLRSAPRGF